MIDDLLSSVKLLPLHVHDAKRLRDSGILNGSIQTIENRLRSFISSDFIFPYVYSDDEGNVKAFVRLCSYQENSSKLSLHIQTNSIDSDTLSRIVDESLLIGFFKLNVRKITAVIDCENTMFEQALMDNGFVQEAILREEYQIDGRYVDAGLFYILRPEYTKYNYLFLPFPRGIAYIGGGVDYIDQVGFLNYEQQIEDEYLRDSAEYLGLCDVSGLLFKRNSDCYSYDFSDVAYIPAEVKRAYQQLIEYFLKKRQTFDLNLVLRDLTDFQISVLEVLKTIPYGSTVSYEDVALKLTDNDYQKARKLTRAVGSACGSNPIPIIIPCHRVIGKNGMLVGFSGGIEFKDFLLQNEMFESMIPLY